MTNPLLMPSPHKHGAPAFDLIKEEHFKPAVLTAIEEARANVDFIVNNPAQPNFENVIVALEVAAERLSSIMLIFYNQLSCNGTDGLQALAEELGPVQANFSSDIILNEALFQKVKTVYEQKETLNLTAEQNTLLTETYKNFIRGGALLDEAKKARLRIINEEMSVQGPVFANNVKKSEELFELYVADESELAGLPENAKIAAREAAAEKGKAGQFLFTLDMPSFYPLVSYCDNRALRETIWRGFSSRGYKGEFCNLKLTLDTVKLRHERAQLLGYEHHAAYVLEKRMARDADTVFKFLNDMLGRYKRAAQADLVELKALAQQDGIEEIKPWDVGYYSEKLRKKLFDFSSEDLRAYFPLDKVLAGMFTHFEKLFGISFKENKAYPVWHKDVTAYDVTDQKTGEFVGMIYADFFPRTGKKPGAWMTTYREQGLFNGVVQRPLTAFVCNFTKPTEHAPSLLTFDEVETIYHEMGHVTHALLSDVTYGSLASPNVLWDFVELPSQIQENWLYEDEVLNSFAAHYQTGEKIPTALIQKLKASKNFMTGWAGLRQNAFGLLDMKWHVTDPATIHSVEEFEDSILKDILLFPRMAGPVSTSFAHIFAGGYAAGYYSYKWAEVLDADVYAVFEEKGLYNQEVASSYRREILSKGGTEDPKILYARFRGRDATSDALLKREGLIEDGVPRKAV